MAPTTTRRRKSIESEIYLESSKQCSKKDGDKGKDNNEMENVLKTSGYCTPKAKKFRIPEMLACPAAPIKKRVTSKLSSKTKRSPIALFAPPDLELLFLSLSNMPLLLN